MALEPIRHLPAIPHTPSPGHRTGHPPRPSGRTYEAVALHNFERVPQIRGLPEALREEVRVVAQVLPFKTNRYVIDHLIDWRRVPDDPIFRLTFPHRDVLAPSDFDRIATLLRCGAPAAEIRRAADAIRLTLNPHPAGQLSQNVPSLDGRPLPGMQHKYRETVLFFPSQGQTCHAYCTFCFRWPQFVGMDGIKFATQEAESLWEYVERHPAVTDVLITGGDPLIMRTALLRAYLRPLLEEGRAHHVTTVRIGSKALGYWPQRLLWDDDARDLLALFKEVVDSGRQLAFMAHFNHPAELMSPIALEAIRVLRRTGAQIRTQTPLLRHINDDPGTLADMWRLQARLGCVPYYLFVARDTGARRYFELPLARCLEIYREAYGQISGLARTVRGPSMSATPGKVQVLGVAEISGERVFVLSFLQARDPAWVGRPFFAKYSEEACWLDDLEPASGEREFFFEAGLREMLANPGSPWSGDQDQPAAVRLPAG